MHCPALDWTLTRTATRVAQGAPKYVYLWNQRRQVGRMTQHQINTVRRRRLIDQVTQHVPLVRPESALTLP